VAEYLKKAPARASAGLEAVRDTVTRIIDDVRERGLDAVREYSARFDHWEPPSFIVAEKEIAAAKASIAPNVLASLDFAHEQIKGFAQRQRDSLRVFEVETRPGVILGQKHIPVANVGAYVPGGKYPMLMSAQMSILTAKVAGVQRVVGCAPPYQGNGIYPEMLWSMALAGADEIWCVGGVQALALMAYGAEGYAPVEFIAGPGNMYVAEAKRQLFGTVGIDLLAGDSQALPGQDAPQRKANICACQRDRHTAPELQPGSRGLAHGYVMGSQRGAGRQEGIEVGQMSSHLLKRMVPAALVSAVVVVLTLGVSIAQAAVTSGRDAGIGLPAASHSADEREQHRTLQGEMDQEPGMLLDEAAEANVSGLCEPLTFLDALKVTP
jgi:hypothetical protein